MNSRILSRCAIVGLIALLTACGQDPAQAPDPLTDAGDTTPRADAGSPADAAPGGDAFVAEPADAGSGAPPDAARLDAGGGQDCVVDDTSTGVRPYLQTVAEDSVWVSWKTAAGAPARVEYGASPTRLDHGVNAATLVLAADYHYHAAQLTGLAPATRYYYRVVSGTEASQVFHFRTARPLGTATGHFRFLIFGDHQIRNEDRHTHLVRGAFEKVQELYGCDVDDAIDVIVNVGDQVDVGTLDHWEHIHFEQSSLISPYLAQMTLVGNHETYYDDGLANYRAHFFLDQTSYNGNYSPDNERYYAFQLGSVLFLMLDSEHPDDAQAAWVEQVIAEARLDPEVRWIYTLSHRPIQAEQYVGDVSPFMRDRVVPTLLTTEKAAMFIGAHHHIYARGQHRERPMYHIISGGTAWDQVWGQSTERDFDDVQKTIDFWAYQIVDIDLERQEMTVESYAVGSPRLGFTLDNELINRFHRRFGRPAPAKPQLANAPAAPIELPYSFVSSPYTTSSGELANSTQFQISQSPSFSTLELDLLRDHEDYYGTTGAPMWRTVDKNQGLDLFRANLGALSLVSGTHHVRVRHRDRNLEWSPWSDPVAFQVQNGGSGVTVLATGKSVYAPGEPIDVTYAFGPGHATDWIGLYRAGQTPGQGGATADAWQYAAAPAGALQLAPSVGGQLFVGFFADDGYQELAPRVPVYVGATPVVTTSEAAYDEGETVSVHYSGAPGGAKDWIGVYRASQTPGQAAATQWQYVTGGAGAASFIGLAKGFYYLAYFVDDGFLAISPRVRFSVGQLIASVATDKPSYGHGEPVVVSFQNGPATAKDYVGIFRAGATPGVDVLVSYRYVDGRADGSVTFPARDLPPGMYFAALYINDSYTEVSPRVAFLVQ